MGNFDVFDVFLPDRQNLTRQIFKAIQCLVKDSDHPSKYIFEKSASVKISPVKIPAIRYSYVASHVPECMHGAC